MALQKTWRLFPENPTAQKQLSQALGISLSTAQILLNRGLESADKAHRFLNPSLKDLPNPFSLPDMEVAVRRLIQAIKKNERIAVYGDYDVDGLTSTALLLIFFKALGMELSVHIPDRVKEGYGVQTKVLEEMKAKGVHLVITVDCGTKSHEALNVAKDIGLDVIITDHHELDISHPKAYAFINPKRLPQGRPGRELAGVGVAFFLLMALRQKMREENLFRCEEPNLKQHLDIVALGTIGDLAPLTGINRILCSFGLKELASTNKPGLIALKEVSCLERNFEIAPEGCERGRPWPPCQRQGRREPLKIEPSDVGFRLAPRINAGGRISKASLGLDLLTCDNLERARGLAKILDQCNSERQTMQEKHLKEAFIQVENKRDPLGLVVASDRWHVGIVGLVASKLTENFYRPSIALSIEGELARGSARSIRGIDIVAILENCRDCLVQFGGHMAAAGLTLRFEHLKAFEEKFEKILKEKTVESDFVPVLQVDCELKLKEIERDLLRELESLKPFGIKNPEPIFLSRQVKFRDVRLVKEKHLKCSVSDDEIRMEAIGFNMGSFHPLETDQGDVAFVPEWNTYLGTKIIQLKIKDLKIDTARKNV